MEETESGRRVTLPRHYTQADIVVTAVSAAVAVWMGVWVDDLASGYPRQSTLGLAFMAAVGLAFAAVALSQGLRILAPRVIEERPGHLILGRRLGVRTVLRHRVARDDIVAAEQVRDEPAPAGGAGVVRLQTRTGHHLIGRGLDPETLAWLEVTVRRLAGVS